MQAKSNGATPLKSFEELGAAMQPKKYQQGPINTCEPLAMRRLVKIVGNQTKVGEMIGVSGSHIGACLKNNEARLAYELAAKALLADMDREVSRPFLFVVEVRKDQKELFDTFIRGMNLKATAI